MRYPNGQDRRAHCVHSLSNVVVSDSVNIQIIDLSGENDLEKGLFYPRGFHSNMTGTVELEGAGNIEGQTVKLAVVAGLQYPYSFKKILASTTGTIASGCTSLVVALR